MADSIDSNVTGARVAEETTPGVLPGTPVWYPVEPNSYNDFGGQPVLKAREPIKPNRQKNKGNIIDEDASGGYVHDFTETGLLRTLQGFFYADARIPGDTQPIDGTSAVTITGTTTGTNTISAASGLDIFAVGDIVLLSGFGKAATNGLKTIATAAAGSITTSEAIGASEVSPPSTARVQKVGISVAASDLAVVISGAEVSLTSAGDVDFTALGLVPGSWIHIGSDDNAFVASRNTCFARIDEIVSATEIRLGKTTKQMVAVAAGPAVDIFLPTFVLNEPDDADIVSRTYQLERTLGRDDNGVQSEYLTGATPNEMTITIPSVDNVTVEVTYVAMSSEYRDGTTGVKSGTRPSLVSEGAFNSSSDVKRMRIAVIAADNNPFPTALFGYASEGTIMVNNNVTPNKGVGYFGSFSMNKGMFEIGGSWEAYFTTVAALQAIKDNSDVTLDIALVRNNVGWIFDIPLLALGGGRVTVEANSPIKLPLETSAGESVLGHTMMVAHFPYLPDVAAA